MKIALLGSGAGSNFEALQKAILRGELNAEIILVISDREDAGILEKAHQFGIPSIFEKGGADFSERVAKKLVAKNVQIVCLAGLMRLIKEPLLEAFPNRILNIHPSLLPLYPGKEAWKQALEDGASETGCTVHLVDAGMDTGEVILQKRLPILEDDTPETLHTRIQHLEYQAYPEALQGFMSTTTPILLPPHKKTQS